MAYRELLPSIVNGESRLAAWSVGLLFQFVEGPDLQGWLAREVFGYCYEQRCAWDLLHVSNGAGFMGLELADDLEGARDDADDAILAAQEDIVGPGRNAGNVPLLQQSQGGAYEDGEWGGTSKSDASGSLTWETSKNLNGFHCSTVSVGGL